MIQEYRKPYTEDRIIGMVSLICFIIVVGFTGYMLGITAATEDIYRVVWQACRK